MLFSIFMPIFIFVLLGTIKAITYSSNPLWSNDSKPLIEILMMWFIFLFELTFPLWIGLWIFWSGQWRLPFFISGIVCLGITLLGCVGYWENDVPPEERVITWSLDRQYDGTDVYCNGVYLGQTPLDIRVDKLKAKVPEWTSPPEQKWFSDNLYTWIPYDDFRSKERFEEVKKLFNSETPSLSTPAFRKKLSAVYEADCRYWWRFENNKNIIIASTYQPNLHTTFEKIGSSYHADGHAFSLSAPIHARLLFNVLGELTESEKNDLDRHVLKHWSTLRHPLIDNLMVASMKYRTKNPNDPRIKILETALDSTARMKYGLSDPPTEEECRKLLTTWMKESANYQSFQTNFEHDNMTGAGANIHAKNDEQPLIDAAIKLMGKTVQKPLAELWKENYRRTGREMFPLIYLSQTDRNAEYFDNFVHYSAASKIGYEELMANQDERVIPLFRTLLFQKTFPQRLVYLFKDDDDRCLLDQNYISFYGQVNNPLLEPVLFEYMNHALSRPKLSDSKRNDLNWLIVGTIQARIRQEIIDEKELTTRILSLQISRSSKDLLLKGIQNKLFKKQPDEKESDEAKSFSDLLQQADASWFFQQVGYSSRTFIKTQKTVEDVIRWFTENPEGTLDKFLRAFENDFELGYYNNSVDYRGKNPLSITTSVEDIQVEKQPLHFYIGQPIYIDDFKRRLVTVLLKTNTPETQKIIKQLCNNPKDSLTVWLAIREAYPTNLYDYSFTDRDANLIPNSDLVVYSEISIDCPDYIFDVLEKLQSGVIDDDIYYEKGLTQGALSSFVVYCSSPRAGQLLEKWSQTEDKEQKQGFTENLKLWHKRKEIQEQKKELFHKLVEGKILPDELLTPQSPWVWKENGYVQVPE
jgi:hypothetical protein